MILLKSYIKNSPVVILWDDIHAVRIDSVAETLTVEKCSPWKDRTPQLSIRYKNKDGYITQWINLVGYMTKDDYNESAQLAGIVFKAHPYSKIQYAVDIFTGNRVENPAKTAMCMQILCRIGHCAGIKDGTNFEIADLVGLELGISVVNRKVNKTFKKI